MVASSTLLTTSAAAPKVLLLIAALVAVVDWVSVARPDVRMRRLEYVVKPAIPILLLAAVLLAPASDGGVQVIAALALLFSCGGDVALMLPDTKGSLFLVGLSSFLVAQVLFAVGFLIQPHGSLLACVVVMLLVAGGPSAIVLRSVRHKAPEVLGPVGVYVAAITLMAAAAIAVGIHDPARRVPAPAIIGGLSFVASDLLLAINKFVRPLRHESLIVHVTYHVALFGLTIGMLALS